MKTYSQRTVTRFIKGSINIYFSEKFVTEIRHDMGLKTFIKRRFPKEEEIYYKLNDLQRFVKIQEKDFQRALFEIRQGRKQSHWIWFIFPQMRGLGHSAYSNGS